MGDKSLTLPMKVNGEVDQRFTYEGEWEVDQLGGQTDPEGWQVW